MAIAILLNNWFHDLSVALFTCSLLVIATAWRVGAAFPAPGQLLVALDRLAVRIAWASATGIAVFGAVRVAAFREYEWLPAVGKGIVVALAVKHAVLASAVAVALVAALRARARGRALLAGAAR